MSTTLGNNKANYHNTTYDPANARVESLNPTTLDPSLAMTDSQAKHQNGLNDKTNLYNSYQNHEISSNPGHNPNLAGSDGHEDVHGNHNHIVEKENENLTNSNTDKQQGYEHNKHHHHEIEQEQADLSSHIAVNIVI